MTAEAQNLTTILLNLQKLWANQDLLDSPENQRAVLESFLEYSKYLQGIDVEVAFDKSFDFETAGTIKELKDEVARLAANIEGLEKKVITNNAIISELSKTSSFYETQMLKKANKEMASQVEQLVEDKGELENRLTKSLFPGIRTYKENQNLK